MIPTRVFFKKEGRAKYISHLDMSRFVARALKKSGLPVWYTEGFNPHIYTTFALPLSLGYESECESFDMRLLAEIEESVVIEKLNQCLSEGVEVFHVAEPVMKPEAIKWADYEIELYFDNVDNREICKKLEQFFDQDQILVQKKTKKKDKEVDLKPLFEVLSISSEEQSISLNLRIASGIMLNINPSLLIKAFCEEIGTEYGYIRTIRKKILTEQLEDFR